MSQDELDKFAELIGKYTKEAISDKIDSVVSIFVFVNFLSIMCVWYLTQ